MLISCCLLSWLVLIVSLPTAYIPLMFSFKHHASCSLQDLQQLQLEFSWLACSHHRLSSSSACQVGSANSLAGSSQQWFYKQVLSKTCLVLYSSAAYMRAFVPVGHQHITSHN